ncbi:P-loop containing nucleoside triphosphate hydrolase protein [Lactarius akahatsu]|uniref:P-loop containing nucleoside triphosphate hydrolase protein n=1 Tax=Lactarius akahatsu TaxID=416441 RepID=A0AAD4LJ28_9AGAM|nr:P-loop containing nucleoside triphosphate hydrolase protein [Lactarius akahatsu]
MRLQIVFTDNTRLSGKEFVMLRELRGRATFSGSYIGSAHSREPVSLPSASSSAISVPTPITSDPPVTLPVSAVTVSHESGLYFVVEGIEIAGQLTFSPVDLAILIEKTKVVSSLTVAVKLFPSPGTPESCFKVTASGGAGLWKESIFVSFQAPDAGTFRACLQITFAQPGSKKFVVLRELCGHATLGSHVGDAPPSEPFPRRNLVDDHAVLSTEEVDVLPDNQGTGISISDDDGVDFGIVEREDINGPFAARPSSVTINHAKDLPVVTFVEARIRSLDGSDSSFRATFEGDSLTIRPGTERTVQIEFIPEFEGRFEATLQLKFSQSQQLGHFAVSRRLRAISGSVEDHQRFESLNQEGYIPRSGSGQQIPPEKIVLLPSLGGPFSFGNLPEYKLPSLVQEAVDGATFRHPYNKKAPHLIATLRPTELTMDTYAKYFTALLNVEEGHQQRDILDQRPFEVEVQERDSRYFVEFENLDEDLLPEEDVYYDARIANANVFLRGNLTVLKISLRVPTSFKLYRGAIFLLRFRLNRITLRRQYRALSSSLAHFRRFFFPSPSDIKQIQPLSMAGIAELPLVNENIREDDQQLQAVISILQEPKGSVSFIIFGPPGTGKTSTLVESIMQLLRRDANFKILACTPSNAAADLLVERLAAAGLTVNQLLRLNARSRDMKSIPELVRTFSVNRECEDLLAFRVVISTCSSAGLLQMENIPAGHFSHILFSNKDTNVILAGDPQQLGPVIKSSPASEAGLGKSYLERLIHIPQIYELDTQVGKTIVDLQRNRRSHGAIIAWPNRYLYKDRMHASASPDVSHLLLQSDVLPRMGFPIVFHGIKGRELRTQHSPSYLNVHEASVVRDYCLRLTEDREHKIFAKEIGVIAPYKAQVRAIRELLGPADLKDVTVGSVEKLQGQERLVIIFATTRSNSEVDKRKAMGFLQNRRRMNVAITRAQALLIVVGDPEVLGKDELWRTFLNYACLREGWTGKALNWNPEEHIDCFVLHGELAKHRRGEDHQLKCGFGEWKAGARRPAPAILPSLYPYVPAPKPSNKRARKLARKEEPASTGTVPARGVEHLSVSGEEGLDFKSEIGAGIDKKTIAVIIQKTADNVSLTLVDVAVTGAGSRG